MSVMLIMALLAQPAYFQIQIPTDIYAYEPDTASEKLGSSSAICDVNGDGYMDIVVGAATKIKVFHGVAAGGSYSLATTVTTSTTSIKYIICQDLNSDSCADVVAGKSS